MTMRILISTPLYPPQIGGPSQYSFHINEELEKLGHNTRLVKYGIEIKMPSLIRHLFYFLKILPGVIWAQRVLVFDASSVGVPTALACRLLRKKYIVRIGGDFLWEMYIERTGAEISLPNFYKNIPQLTKKEKIIKSITSYVLKNASKVVVNTEWLIDIIKTGYGIPANNITCIYNFFAGVSLSEPEDRVFIASGRPIKLKNIQRLKEAFKMTDQAQGLLVTEEMGRDRLMETIKSSYVTVVASYSDVSPNLVLDGLSNGKPFILTKYNGLPSVFRNLGIFVDPFDSESIMMGITSISDAETYRKFVENIKQLDYIHSWEDITKEFEGLLQ